MARLPALVAALAETDDRGVATLNQFARVIREAGHIRTTRRGLGAAVMTTRDAANLLLGANAAESPHQAPAALEWLRSLPGRGNTVALLPRSVPRSSRPLLALDRAKTFGEAVEVLVDYAPRISAEIAQQGPLWRALSPGRPDGRWKLGLTVSIRREIDAFIAVQALSETSLSSQYFWYFGVERSLLVDTTARASPRRTVVELDLPVFEQLNAALFPAAGREEGAE